MRHQTILLWGEECLFGRNERLLGIHFLETSESNISVLCSRRTEKLLIKELLATFSRRFPKAPPRCYKLVMCSKPLDIEGRKGSREI